MLSTEDINSTCTYFLGAQADSFLQSGGFTCESFQHVAGVSPSHHVSQTALIAGGTVGGIALIMLLIGILVFLARRQERRRRRVRDAEENEPALMPELPDSEISELAEKGGAHEIEDSHVREIEGDVDHPREMEADVVFEMDGTEVSPISSLGSDPRTRHLQEMDGREASPSGSNNSDPTQHHPRGTL